jgi:hypothetical protein
MAKSKHHARDSKKQEERKKTSYANEVKSHGHDKLNEVCMCKRHRLSLAFSLRSHFLWLIKEIFSESKREHCRLMNHKSFTGIL